MPNLLSRIFLCFTLILLAACGGVPEASRGPMKVLPGSPPPGDPVDMAALAGAIEALGPDIDPEEAARAARISYEHTYELALQYQITDPALIHNVKVNMGLKPRGLCKDWAEDMERRLEAENFETLDIHRGIGRLVGVDHSTAIISRKGEDMYQGIVVDPWRKGGRLTWIHTIEDTAWGWQPQLAVLDRRARDLAREKGKDSIIYSVPGLGPRCIRVANADGSSRAVTTSEEAAACLADPGAGFGAAMAEIDSTAQVN
ncbi:MAG: hypothetical protein LJE62_11720 [Silicimonas sp.]|nr:hypothetical protein [Silicimonas sp.]